MFCHPRRVPGSPPPLCRGPWMRDGISQQRSLNQIFSSKRALVRGGKVGQMLNVLGGGVNPLLILTHINRRCCPFPDAPFLMWFESLSRVESETSLHIDDCGGILFSINCFYWSLFKKKIKNIQMISLYNRMHSFEKVTLSRARMRGKGCLGNLNQWPYNYKDSIITLGGHPKISISMSVFWSAAPFKHKILIHKVVSGVWLHWTQAE